MQQEYILVKKSTPLTGEVLLSGAKNAVLPIMASLLLTSGVSILKNVPRLTDVEFMVTLLQELGAKVVCNYDQNILIVDTTDVHKWQVSENLMKKMRASIVVLGPLLARFKSANLAMLVVMKLVCVLLIII